MDGLDSVPYTLQKKFICIPFLNNAGVVRQCRRKQKIKNRRKKKMKNIIIGNLLLLGV
nr:MAG TPA: hypothetical protein [Caudoviricetes sp.]